ncbi:hypothetical protein Sango_0085100 [Sesamum angolense]|uniref:Reverse transcriptase domain-containing protein n=1 Tax=Sesamum angolense TaxID=2727404 RepID=A0AAE2C5U5_9LAMI|nr:hypothetical protein Sango_0085100 [Sesamum angolense]
MREVPHINHELLASIIQQNLLPGRFKESIAGKPPSTMEDLLMRSQKYIRIEESNSSDPSPGVKRKGREEEKEPRKKEERKHVLPTGFTYYTPLNASWEEILIVTEQQGLINQRPRKMKDNPKKLKSDKYCRFHQDRGHTTEECHHLNNEIEKLIQRGHLKQYVNREQSRQPQETTSTQHPNSDNLPQQGYRRDFGRPSRRGFRQCKESPGSRSQEKQLANAQPNPQHKLKQVRRNRVRRARPRSDEKS